MLFCTITLTLFNSYQNGLFMKFASDLLQLLLIENASYDFKYTFKIRSNKTSLCWFNFFLMTWPILYCVYDLIRDCQQHGCFTLSSCRLFENHWCRQFKKKKLDASNIYY